MTFFTFIWIPKCAGTTISKTFGFSRPPPEKHMKNKVIYDKNITTGHRDVALVLQNRTPEFKKFYDESFKFCIVRNPYDRAVSLFHFFKLNQMCSFDEWFVCLYKHKTDIPNNDLKGVVYNKLINSCWNLMGSWIPDDIDKIYFFEDGLVNIVNDINQRIGTNKKIDTVNSYNKSIHKPFTEYYKYQKT